MDQYIGSEKKLTCRILYRWVHVGMQKTFVGSSQTAKLVKVFFLKSFPLVRSIPGHRGHLPPPFFPRVMQYLSFLTVYTMQYHACP